MTHPDMRLVPVEPTEAMVEAGRAASHYQSYMGRVGPESLTLAYRAMLAAAPHQTQPDAREEAPEGAGEWITGEALYAIMESFDGRADVTEIAEKINTAISLRAQQPADDEETYQIGLRDGYERAIQEIDLATGGDGEFKATTDQGVIDVPVMKRRLIDRFSQQPADDKLAKAVEALEKAVWSLSSFGQLVADEEGGNTEGLDDEVIVRMTFPDPKFGGEKTLLGELFIRAFRKAKAATDECRQALAALKAETRA